MWSSTLLRHHERNVNDVQRLDMIQHQNEAVSNETKRYYESQLKNQQRIYEEKLLTLHAENRKLLDAQKEYSDEVTKLRQTVVNSTKEKQNNNRNNVKHRLSISSTDKSIVSVKTSPKASPSSSPTKNDDEMKKYKTICDNKIKQVQKSSQNELTRLKQEHESYIKGMNDKFEKERKFMEINHKKELKLRLEDTIKSYDKRKEIEFDQLRNDMIATAKFEMEKLEQMNKLQMKVSLEETMRSYDKRKEMEFEQLRTEMIAAATTEMEQLQQKHRNELDRQEKKYHDDIQKIKQKTKAECEEQCHKVTKEYTTQIAELQKQLTYHHDHVRYDIDDVTTTIKKAESTEEMIHVGQLEQRFEQIQALHDELQRRRNDNDNKNPNEVKLLQTVLDQLRSLHDCFAENNYSNENNKSDNNITAYAHGMLLQRCQVLEETMKLNLEKYQQQLHSYQVQLEEATTLKDKLLFDSVLLKEQIHSLQEQSDSIHHDYQERIQSLNESESVLIEEQNEYMNELEMMEKKCMKMENEISLRNEQLLTKEKLISDMKKQLEELRKEYSISKKQHVDEIQQLQIIQEAAISELTLHLTGKYCDLVQVTTREQSTNDISSELKTKLECTQRDCQESMDTMNTTFQESVGMSIHEQNEYKNQLELIQKRNTQLLEEISLKNEHLSMNEKTLNDIRTQLEQLENKHSMAQKLHADEIVELQNKHDASINGLTRRLAEKDAELIKLKSSEQKANELCSELKTKLEYTQHDYQESIATMNTTFQESESMFMQEQNEYKSRLDVVVEKYKNLQEEISLKNDYLFTNEKALDDLKTQLEELRTKYSTSQKQHADEIAEIQRKQEISINELTSRLEAKETDLIKAITSEQKANELCSELQTKLQCTQRDYEESIRLMTMTFQESESNWILEQNEYKNRLEMLQEEISLKNNHLSTMENTLADKNTLLEDLRTKDSITQKQHTDAILELQKLQESKINELTLRLEEKDADLITVRTSEQTTKALCAELTTKLHNVEDKYATDVGALQMKLSDSISELRYNNEANENSTYELQKLLEATIATNENQIAEIRKKHELEMEGKARRMQGKLQEVKDSYKASMQNLQHEFNDQFQSLQADKEKLQNSLQDANKIVEALRLKHEKEYQELCNTNDRKIVELQKQNDLDIKIVQESLKASESKIEKYEIEGASLNDELGTLRNDIERIKMMLQDSSAMQVKMMESHEAAIKEMEREKRVLLHDKANVIQNLEEQLNNSKLAFEDELRKNNEENAYVISNLEKELVNVRQTLENVLHKNKDEETNVIEDLQKQLLDAKQSFKNELQRSNDEKKNTIQGLENQLKQLRQSFEAELQRKSDESIRMEETFGDKIKRMTAQFQEELHLAKSISEQEVNSIRELYLQKESELIAFKSSVSELQESNKEFKNKYENACEVIKEKEQVVCTNEEKIAELIHRKRKLAWAKFFADVKARNNVKALQDNLQSLKKELDEKCLEFEQIKQQIELECKELQAKNIRLQQQKMNETSRTAEFQTEYVKSIVVKMLSTPSGSDEWNRSLPILASILLFKESDYRKIEEANNKNTWFLPKLISPPPPI